MKPGQPTSVRWQKSSYSGSSGGNCVETAPLTGVIGVRDSKDTTRGHFTVAPGAWASFLGALKH